MAQTFLCEKFLITNSISLFIIDRSFMYLGSIVTSERSHYFYSFLVQKSVAEKKFTEKNLQTDLSSGNGCLTVNVSLVDILQSYWLILSMHRNNT